MLGYDKPLVWFNSADGITVKLPVQFQEANKRPCDYAWLIKIKNK